MHPGATWRKTDFQVHTPRDAQWDGPSPDGSTSAGQAQRLEWANSLIRIALQKGLGAIAITDHHDVTYIHIIRDALKELQAIGEARGFWLFPGMEVTCDDNCQCILLFDTELPFTDLRRMYGGLLRNVAEVDASIARMPQNALSGHDVAGFYSAVSDDPILGPRMVCLPHAGDPGSSHKSILQNGFQSRFRDLPCDGVYIEKPYTSLNYTTKQKIEGKFSHWGTRRRGIVSTGDNRREDFRDLNSNPCWIRLGEPTAESIRQALLADEARITYTPPALPTHRVTRVEVDSTLCGPNFCLAINDGFNAVIGGRGSGKSSALEYLRFGLGRSAFEGAGVQEEGNRVQQLLSDTLVTGSVKVTLARGEIEETWTRTLAKQNVIQVGHSDGSSEEITIEVAQQRFPARGYHQKELSTVISSKRFAAEQITGIAGAELVTERRQNDSSRATATLALRTAFQRLVEYWSAVAADERARSAVADLNRQIAALQERLKAAGLSDKTQKILALAPEYTRVAAFVSAAIESVNETRTALVLVNKNLFEASEDLVVSSDTDFDSIREIMTDAKASAVSINAAITTVVGDVTALAGRLTSHEDAFIDKKRLFEERLAIAVAEQQQHSTLLTEASQLNAALQAGERAARQAAERLKEREAAPGAFEETRRQLTTLLSARLELLARAAVNTSTMSDGLLKAAVVPASPSEEQISSIYSMLEGSRIRSPEEKVKDHVKSVVRDANGWPALCDKFVELCRIKILTASPSGDAPTLDASTRTLLEAAFSFETLTEFGRQMVWSKITPTTVTSVLSATSDAFVEFEFKDHDGRYIPFERASPGQQAAALLTLLLKQKAGTLIIDQPEDDLDNRVIMQIAALLRTTKTNRQLIFATHNPNFVVNGDADKVVVMNSGSAQIATPSSASYRMSLSADGAIETPEVRNAITEIMEGGKAAFELRGRKYDFSN